MILYTLSSALYQDPNLSQSETTGYQHLACCIPLFSQNYYHGNRDKFHVSFFSKMEEVHYSELLCQTLPPTLI